MSYFEIYTSTLRHRNYYNIFPYFFTVWSSIFVAEKFSTIIIINGIVYTAHQIIPWAVRNNTINTTKRKMLAFTDSVFSTKLQMQKKTTVMKGVPLYCHKLRKKIIIHNNKANTTAQCSFAFMYNNILWKYSEFQVSAIALIMYVHSQLAHNNKIPIIFDIECNV